MWQPRMHTQNAMLGLRCGARDIAVYFVFCRLTIN